MHGVGLEVEVAKRIIKPSGMGKEKHGQLEKKARPWTTPSFSSSHPPIMVYIFPCLRLLVHEKIIIIIIYIVCTLP